MPNLQPLTKNQLRIIPQELLDNSKKEAETQNAKKIVFYARNYCIHALLLFSSKPEAEDQEIIDAIIEITGGKFENLGVLFMGYMNVC